MVYRESVAPPGMSSSQLVQEGCVRRLPSCGQIRTLLFQLHYGFLVRTVNASIKTTCDSLDLPRGPSRMQRQTASRGKAWRRFHNSITDLVTTSASFTVVAIVL